jgi:hypothetical protein
VDQLVYITLTSFFAGVIVAVLGLEPEDDEGKFVVEDYCFQMLPQQVPRPTFSEDK